MASATVKRALEETLVTPASSVTKKKRSLKERDQELLAWLNKNVRAIVLEPGTEIYHGGSITEEDAQEWPLDKDGPNCAWFAFEAGHSADYAASKSEDRVEGLYRFETRRPLLLLDFRPTVYAPKLSLPSQHRGSDDESEGDPEKSDFESPDEDLYMNHFSDPHLEAINKFGAQSDQDFAPMVAELLARHSADWPIDGFVSLDYGMFAELILFSPSAKLLEYQETLPIGMYLGRPGHDYAFQSLTDTCFLKQNPGDLYEEDEDDAEALALHKSCAKWNDACDARPISAPDKAALENMAHARLY